MHMSTFIKRLSIGSKEQEQETIVFGVPLEVSLRYAGVRVTLPQGGLPDGPNGFDGPGSPGSLEEAGHAAADAGPSNGAAMDARHTFAVTVPLIVAKCGARLRASGLDREGIFRRSGAARRITALQEVFDSPAQAFGAHLGTDHFSAGVAADKSKEKKDKTKEKKEKRDKSKIKDKERDKERDKEQETVQDKAPQEAQKAQKPQEAQDVGDTEWAGSTVEDTADVLRRYLGRLPEPVIPLAHYEAFQAPLKKAATAKETRERKEQETPEGQETQDKETAAEYRTLVHGLPVANRDLLLYVLDLLATFAGHAATTRMPATSLAAVFRPSILALAEAGEGLDAAKHQQSQEVLTFLIVSYEALL